MSMDKNTQTQVTVIIPKEDAEKLKIVAAKRRTTISHILRTFIFETVKEAA